MTKSFVVLGMHRSATSLVAKGLAEAGVNMGSPMLGVDQWNPWGHYEHVTAVHLNEALLADAGGSWHQPVPVAASAHARGYVASRQGELWGWKDPRTAFTWPAFRPHMPADTHLVCVFRRSEFVAESLHRRDGIPVEEGLALGERYNAAVLEHAAEHVRHR